MITIKKKTLVEANGIKLAVLTHDASTINQISNTGAEPGKLNSFKINDKIVQYSMDGNDMYNNDMYNDNTKIYSKYTLTGAYEKDRNLDELDVLYKMLNYEGETQLFGLINECVTLTEDERNRRGIFTKFLPYNVWINANAGRLIDEHKRLFTKNRIQAAYVTFYSEFITREYDERSLSLFYSESFKAIRLMLLHDYIYYVIRYGRKDYDTTIRVLLGSLSREQKMSGSSLQFLRPILDSNITKFGLPGYLAFNELESTLKGGGLELSNNAENTIVRRNGTINQLGLNFIKPYQNLDYTFGESYFTQNGENLVNTIQSSMVISNVVNKTPLENPIELTGGVQNNLISSVNLADLRTLNYVSLANEYQEIKDEVVYLPTYDAKVQLLLRCKDLINKIRLSEKEYIAPNISDDEDPTSANELSILATKVSELADEIANVNVYYGAGEQGQAGVSLSYEMVQLKKVFLGHFKAFKNTLLTFWKTPINEVKLATKMLTKELRGVFNVLFPIKSVTKGTMKEIKKVTPGKESFNYTKVNMVAICEEMNDHIKYLTKEEGNLYIPAAEGLDVIFNLKKGQLALIVNAVLAGIKISRNEKHITAIRNSMVAAIEEVVNKNDEERYKDVLNDSIKKVNKVADEQLKKVQAKANVKK